MLINKISAIVIFFLINYIIANLIIFFIPALFLKFLLTVNVWGDGMFILICKFIGILITPAGLKIETTLLSISEVMIFFSLFWVAYYFKALPFFQISFARKLFKVWDFSDYNGGRSSMKLNLILRKLFITIKNYLSYGFVLILSLVLIINMFFLSATALSAGPESAQKTKPAQAVAQTQSNSTETALIVVGVLVAGYCLYKAGKWIYNYFNDKNDGDGGGENTPLTQDADLEPLEVAKNVFAKIQANKEHANTGEIKSIHHDIPMW